MRAAASFAVCLIASAVAAGEVSSHGTITPAEAQVEATQRFEIAVPNESINIVLDGFRLTPPEGATVEAAEAGGRWSIAREGRVVVWADGEVQAGETATFAFTARLPASGTVAIFQGEEGYVGFGRTGAFPFEVTLSGGAAPAAAFENEPSPGRAAVTAVVLVSLLVLALVILLARTRGRNGSAT